MPPDWPAGQVAGVDGAGCECDGRGSEGFGGTDEGAEIAGVLQAVGDEEEVAGAWGVGNFGAFEESGRALCVFGLGGALEGVGTQEQDFAGGVFRKVAQKILVVFAEVERIELQAAGDGFADEMEAFDADAVGLARG